MDTTEATQHIHAVCFIPDRAVDEHSLMVPASPFLLHRDDGNDLHVTGWPKTKLGLDFPAH